MDKDQKEVFEEEGSNGRKSGLIGELVGMLMEKKKWWILPILVCLLVLGMIIMIGGSSFSPFLYPGL